MKPREIAVHVALFVVAYASFLGYHYRSDQHSDKPQPLTDSTAADAESTVLSVTSRNTPRIQSTGAMSSEPGSRQPSSHPAVQTRIEPSSNQTVAYQAATSVEEISTLSVLMSDPDPEVARLAREMYNHAISGE